MEQKTIRRHIVKKHGNISEKEMNNIIEAVLHFTKKMQVENKRWKKMCGQLTKKVNDLWQIFLQNN